MLSCAYRGRIRYRDGEYRWVETLFQTFANPTTELPSGYAVTMRDINEQKLQEELLASLNRKLSEDATHDELTSLPNRRLFNEALARQMRHQARDLSSAALMMLDIDLFKQFNDTYGHIEGDQCLKRVAATLVKTLRRESDIVARFGGEEFVILLSMTRCEGAKLLAAAILEAIRAMALPHVRSPKGFLTISIGVACWASGSVADPKKMLEQADAALYRSKNSGRDTYNVEYCGGEGEAAAPDRT